MWYNGWSMTDEPALLAAVAARPDDDTPRLVYADWLDDHGRPERAEFIHVQCRLAALSPADDDYPELIDRQDELATWLWRFEPLPLPDMTGPLRVAQRGYAEYQRGFAHEVMTISTGTSRTAVNQMFAAVDHHLATSPARTVELYAPTDRQVADFLRRPAAAGIRGLSVNATREVIKALAASPHVRQLRSLLVGGELDERTAAVLAGADLPHLTDLSLQLAVDAPRAITAVAAAPWFQNLRVLRIGEHLGVPHLEALAAVPPMPDLHTLHLGDNRFEWVALRALARSESFPHLAALALGRNPLGDEGVAYLAKAEWSVRSLNLRGCGLSNADVRTLLGGKLLDGVRVLELGGNTLTTPAVKALAASPKLAEVRHLTLAFSKIGKDGFAALGASPHLKHLTRLDVNVFADENGRAKVEDTGAFLNHGEAPRLRRLDLGGQPVGVSGAKALATRPTFANLRWLVLQGGRIGNAGLAALTAAPQLRELVVLDVAANQIAAAPALLDSATFPRLADCKLNFNKLTPTKAQELAARRGVEVYRQDTH